MESLKHAEHSKSGVYKITNIVTGKFYIGSSLCSIYTRIARHKSDLLKNKHVNEHLQNSFNKHGLKAFKVDILEYCEKNVVIQREQYYIDTLKPHFNKIFQIITMEWTEESRKRISESLKEAYRTGRKKPSPQDVNYKAVDQYTLDGKFVATYKSVIFGAKAHNTAQQNIANSCNNPKHTCKGFKWEWAGSPFNYVVPKKFQYKYIIYDEINKKVYKAISRAKAEKALNLPRYCIRRHIARHSQGVMYKDKYSFFVLPNQQNSIKLIKSKCQKKEMKYSKMQLEQLLAMDFQEL